ncbi:transglycosylase domain-containing protein [Streptomyces sp. NPDC051776]|uniref:transglycosylase domain-containing protein n=1 Tax=Streptomyces sp. NPDC051776 TaxID=3155414 RepID=UPI00343DFA0D
MGRADARRARGRGARRARSKSGIRRFFTWRKLLGGFLAVCALFIGAFIALYLYVDVPGANAQAQLQSNTYRYSDGTVIAREGQVNRESVRLTRVPRDVQHAFVAAENKSFYSDSGVDLKGTARGLLNTVTGKGKQGGSTITQQYVKNYFLTQEQTVTRKAKELIISLKVDREKTKDEILEGYLNTSYFGRGAYGIQAAARAYYGVDSQDLSVGQGAYLAALLQAPTQYDWTNAKSDGTARTRVLQRWNYVLDNMAEMDWIDPGKRDGLKFPEPIAPKPAPGLQGQAGYLVRAAKAELLASGVDEQELEAGGGWDITLSIDRKKQRALEKAVKTRLLADLDPKERKVDRHVQPGAASVDPRTGRVLALYGGRDFVKHQISNATRRDYQAASTFKPLVLASALQNGAKTQDGRPIAANTIYDGTSKRPVKGSPTPFAPPNEDNRSYGQVTVQRAMNNSINSVFAQMGVDVGLQEVKDTAVGLGMYEKAGGFVVRPSMSLGVMGASPLDMAGVYATLDNHGQKVTPRLVKSAERGEQKAELPEPEKEQVVERTTADSVTSVLTGVVEDGTGAAARSAGLEIAGKTGTSDDNKSAWFTGYTPDMVTSVGLFGEDPENGRHVTLSGTAGGGRVNGGGYPAEIWAAYTKSALQGKDPAEFDLDTDQGAAITPAPTGSSGTADPDPDPTPTPSDGTASPDEPSPSTSTPDDPSPSVPSSSPPESSRPPKPSPRPTEPPGPGDDDDPQPLSPRRE